MNKRLVWLLTSGAFFSFFVFGFVDNLKGPTLPALLSDLSLDYSQGGTILLGAYLGFMIATLLSGVLADAAGNKIVLLIASILLSIGIAGFSYVTDFWLLFATMMIVGLGMGAIEVGGNTLIVDLHSERRGLYLNLLGVFHGIGSLLVPIYVAQIFNNGVSWRLAHRYTIGLAIVLTLIFLILKYPKQHVQEAEKEIEKEVKGEKKEIDEAIDEIIMIGMSSKPGESTLIKSEEAKDIPNVEQSLAVRGVAEHPPYPHSANPPKEFSWRTLHKAGFTGQMCLFYLLIAFYVMVELGIAAWLVEFLQETRGFSIGRSAFYLSLFFGFIMLGRLLGGLVVDRIGYVQSMFLAIIGAALFIAVALFGPSFMIIALPYSGICLSIIFPTTVAAVSELHKENTSTILGLLFAFGGIGGALGPWAIGVASDHFGIEIGFALLLAYGSVVILSLLILLRISPPKPTGV